MCPTGGGPHLPSAEPAHTSSWELCKTGPDEGHTGQHCGVTLVTAVQANMREGGEANSDTPHLAQDMVHQHCGSPLPAPHWLPLKLTDTGTQLSSPIPCSSEHPVALEMTCGSHHLDIHSIADFTAISPQTRQASGFQP